MRDRQFWPALRPPVRPVVRQPKRQHLRQQCIQCLALPIPTQLILLQVTRRPQAWALRRGS